MVLPSLKAFMTGIIDYAGLFPPAKLDLDPAMRNYAEYLDGKHAWMLGRFIIPAALLKNLTQEEGYRFSVILGSRDSEEDTLKSVRQDLAGIKGFHVEVLETRLPVETMKAASAERWAAYLLSLKSALDESRLKGLELYIEAPEGWERGMEGMASFNRILTNDAVLKRVGFKLRCGGTDKNAFPSIETVAQVIGSCRDQGVVLKCTAGLHHPVRSRLAELDTMQHGFLNVFGAAFLARGSNRVTGEIEACLRDEDPESFRFNEHGFSWRDRTLSSRDVEQMRRDVLTSFGSCSFDEPLHDLKTLGWLD